MGGVETATTYLGGGRKITSSGFLLRGWEEYGQKNCHYGERDYK